MLDLSLPGIHNLQHVVVLMMENLLPRLSLRRPQPDPVHAGGLPVLSFVYAWGGPEGKHPIATLSPTLLGGSSHPSLF